MHKASDRKHYPSRLNLPLSLPFVQTTCQCHLPLTFIWFLPRPTLLSLFPFGRACVRTACRMPSLPSQVGAKRNQSHGCIDGLVANLDLTLKRQTVATWELRTGDCFITMSVKWYNAHYTNIARACAVISQLVDGVATDAQFLNYEVHTVWCDGTNPALAHGNKARVLELRSSFRHASLVDLLG